MDIYLTVPTLAKVMKEVYLPLFRNLINVEASPFMAKIKKTPLSGNKVVAAAQVGLSGGFGFSKEGSNTPKSAPTMYERFTLEPKDMYVNLGISLKAVKLGNTTGAMVDALQKEIESAYTTAKWNTGRSLFGNGTGKLTDVDGAVTASTSVTLDSVKNLKEGLLIDFYSGTTANSANPKRIVSVNRSSKTITLDSAITCADGDFITIQNSYGNELTGLGAIFDSSVTSLYGITKSTQPVIVPSTIDANDSIEDSVITQALRTAERDKNGKVDMILAGDTAYDSYLEYLRANNIRVEESSHEITGGFKAIKFVFGNREVDIVNEGFVPDEEMWGVETGAFQFQHTDWNFATIPGAQSEFQLLENQSIFRALLANYGDLICSNPGGCFKITNCTSTSED